MGKGTTKRQHYVPRFYLKRFADRDGKLHAYRRESDSFFSTTPENICAENYLYEVRAGNPREDEGPYFMKNRIEGMLSGFESRLAPFYEQLLSCCRSRDFEGKRFLDGRLGACLLAANVLVRHPATLAEDRADAQEIAADYLSSKDVPEEEKRIVAATGLADNMAALAELGIMQTALFSDDPRVPVNRVFNDFANKRMLVLEAPAGMPFISCSLPMFVEGIGENGDGFEAAYMPLSSGYAAIFCDARGAAFSRASYGEVAEFNERLLTWSDVWQTAFGRARGSLENAVRDWKAIQSA